MKIYSWIYIHIYKCGLTSSCARKIFKVHRLWMRIDLGSILGPLWYQNYYSLDGFFMENGFQKSQSSNKQTSFWWSFRDLFQKSILGQFSLPIGCLFDSLLAFSGPPLGPCCSLLCSWSASFSLTLRVYFLTFGGFLVSFLVYFKILTENIVRTHMF